MSACSTILTAGVGYIHLSKSTDSVLIRKLRQQKEIHTVLTNEKHHVLSFFSPFDNLCDPHVEVSYIYIRANLLEFTSWYVTI